MFGRVDQLLMQGALILEGKVPESQKEEQITTALKTLESLVNDNQVEQSRLPEVRKLMGELKRLQQNDLRVDSQGVIGQSFASPTAKGAFPAGGRAMPRPNALPASPPILEQANHHLNAAKEKLGSSTTAVAVNPRNGTYQLQFIFTSESERDQARTLLSEEMREIGYMDEGWQTQGSSLSITLSGDQSYRLLFGQVEGATNRGYDQFMAKRGGPRAVAQKSLVEARVNLGNPMASVAVSPQGAYQLQFIFTSESERDQAHTELSTMRGIGYMGAAWQIRTTPPSITLDGDQSYRLLFGQVEGATNRDYDQFMLEMNSELVPFFESPSVSIEQTPGWNLLQTQVDKIDLVMDQGVYRIRKGPSFLSSATVGDYAGYGHRGGKDPLENFTKQSKEFLDLGQRLVDRKSGALRLDELYKEVGLLFSDDTVQHRSSLAALKKTVQEFQGPIQGEQKVNDFIDALKRNAGEEFAKNFDDALYRSRAHGGRMGDLGPANLQRIGTGQQEVLYEPRAAGCGPAMRAMGYGFMLAGRANRTLLIRSTLADASITHPNGLAMGGAVFTALMGAAIRENMPLHQIPDLLEQNIDPMGTMIQEKAMSGMNDYVTRDERRIQPREELKKDIQELKEDVRVFKQLMIEQKSEGRVKFNPKEHSMETLGICVTRFSKPNQGPESWRGRPTIKQNKPDPKYLKDFRASPANPSLIYTQANTGWVGQQGPDAALVALGFTLQFAQNVMEAYNKGKKSREKLSFEQLTPSKVREALHSLPLEKQREIFLKVYAEAVVNEFDSDSININFTQMLGEMIGGDKLTELTTFTDEKGEARSLMQDAAQNRIK